MDTHLMTFAEFAKLPPGEIFKVVTTADHLTTVRAKEINQTALLTDPDPELMFVCKKGQGFDDWAIYYGLPGKGAEWIKQHGDKLTTKERILKIFPCDAETLTHYRY